MASADDLAQLHTARGTDFDALFCRLMIRHHVGGLVMADAVLADTDVEAVRDLARLMRDGQDAEVNALRDLATTAER